MLIPLHLRAWPNEVLHFHLLEFAHSKNELPCHNLVPKGFTRLGDAKRKLHPARLLNIQEVHKNSLCGLWAQVKFAGVFGHGPHFGRKHKIELPQFGPVGASADGAGYFLVDDYLACLRQVASLQGAIESRQGLLGFSQVLHDARIRASVQCLVKGGTKPLPGLHHLFLGLLANFL